nr:immunoglobulin heavy chain junction region [Macaca mulatta]MOY23121.1 immunoglobulin heavy chain junction region [Macaca mulatta]MOY25593.1 immunoglobulin heavy chain junction region [Macaca mulatta]MOY28516.1 immunoglobulin heavy chain junction region [Macaca mulatta]MOY29511.1 immunoglobulin heavy chain junction region [Macaca mulatta]
CARGKWLLPDSW